MEADRNPMPEFDLGIMDGIKETVQRIGRFLLNDSAPDYMSNHYSRIATPEELAQLEPDNRWCDMGTYMDEEF